MKTTNMPPGAKTIFLVEDDSPTVNLYSNRLEQAGFRTAAAFDAQEACGLLPNLSADLIILDLLLPKRGGFELLEAIRSDSRHKATPVLLLSNAYLPEMTQKALKAGGNKALARSECTSSEFISVSRQLVGISDAGGANQSTTVFVSGSEDSGAAGLAEQLKQDLLAEGRSEVAAIRKFATSLLEWPAPNKGMSTLTKCTRVFVF